MKDCRFYQRDHPFPSSQSRVFFLFLLHRTKRIRSGRHFFTRCDLTVAFFFFFPSPRNREDAVPPFLRTGTDNLGLHGNPAFFFSFLFQSSFLLLFSFFESRQLRSESRVFPPFRQPPFIRVRLLFAAVDQDNSAKRWLPPLDVPPPFLIVQENFFLEQGTPFWCDPAANS